MSGIVSSMGNMVEAGVKGLINLAEGYYSSDQEGDEEGARALSRPSNQDEGEAPASSDPASSDPASSPSSSRIPIPTTSRTVSSGPPRDRAASSSTSPSSSSASASAQSSSSMLSKPSHPPRGALVQLLDVPSGWIHLQATYLDGDGGGAKKVRSFGLKNLVERAIEVVVESDLEGQVAFWLGDDDRASSSSSSTTSSLSNTAGSRYISLILPPKSTNTVYLSFQPSPVHDTSRLLPSPTVSEDGGFTPRVLPTLSRSTSNVSPVPSVSNGPMSDASEYGSTSGESSHSVPGSFKGTQASTTSSKKTEPIYRSFSVHGSICIRAVEVPDLVGSIDPASSSHATTSSQMITLPFFATVCRSLFTATLIDPVSGLATGSQISSGQLLVDFGSDCVVGNDYHRDILLVNRSEIELVWTTAVVNSRFKDQVWFSLRDLDSENVFGVDHSSQPVPLPALSSRHLRLELRVKSPVVDFDFDFVLSNVHRTGNIVTCRAVGSGQAEGVDESLKVLSGTSVNFGQVVDGVWARKMITCKNSGDKPLDVHFSATPGQEVVFRLAGVAGDDIDEDVPVDRQLRLQKSGEELSRAATREKLRGRDTSSLRSSIPTSPADSFGGSSYFSHDGVSATDVIRHLSHAASNHSQASSSMKEHSRPPSRALSRVTSRASSHRYHSSAVDSEEEDEVEPPFFGGDTLATPTHSMAEKVASLELAMDKNIPNQLEDITMRPGTEYRMFVLYRPARDLVNPPEVAGALRESSFKIYLDSAPSSSRSAAPSRSRRTLHCIAESCTSLISLHSSSRIDFGEVTVGASKTSTLAITNLSALSAKVEIAAISKVLSTNRNVIVIPPHETVEEKIEFFPRRINDNYEKQIFVRNLLNRANDQLVEIRSKNVDVYNLTLHSHLYRILTPSGSNFLDFGSVVINSPTVRIVLFENLSLAPLLLELSASQPEDVELFLKAEDAPVKELLPNGKYASETSPPPIRVTSPPSGELKERFMETMRELGAKSEAKPKAKSKERGKSTTRASEETSKQSVAASVAAALRKGGRGRPVQLYGNAVVFKDRNLLEEHEYLDLAAGPPIAAHRTSPRSKQTQLLDAIEQEDRSKLSGQHPKIPKLDFAAKAKSIGLLSKDTKPKKTRPPSQGVAPSPQPDAAPPASFGALAKALLPGSTEVVKSPALTAKRAEIKREMSTTDVSKLGVDELLVAFEQHDSRRSAITHSSLEEEEQFVRRTISLRKELTNLTSSGKLVPARNISVPPGSSRQLLVVMTPNGSIRPHITTRAKRADSRIFIKLLDFDRSKLSSASAAHADLTDLPVRDLIIRSSCVRSVLEVQQSSINFGTCEKGEVKSKTIVVHNKSDTVGMFRLRTSGSIASGDLKLGLGRYGVISAFGRKEFENFSFVPSLTGTFNETIVIENVLDSYNDQNVSVKANVRKPPAFTIEPAALEFGVIDPASQVDQLNFVLTNVSKHERTFVVEVKPIDGASFAAISLYKDDTDVGTVLSKHEEEEVEGITQKLKIARRKGKADKIAKYEARLAELGVKQPATSLDSDDVASNQGEEGGGDDEERVEPDSEREKTKSGDQTPENSGATEDSAASTTEYGPKACVTSLSVTLQPNQKSRILLELLIKASHKDLPHQTNTELAASVTVHDRKNADEMQVVRVVASRAPPSTNITSSSVLSSTSASAIASVPASASTPNSASISQAQHPGSNQSNSIVPSDITASSVPAHTTAPTSALPSSQDPLHLALMRHCLDLTLSCPVSPTAFCVGSCLFLPATSALYSILKPHFASFPSDSPSVPSSNSPSPPSPPAPASASTTTPTTQTSRSSSGLILAEGYSRQIPGNTHAEANALTNFRSKLLQLHSSALGVHLPQAEEILREAECYATMEPCSIRTSGGPSCALELVKAGVRRVWLGVEEPPDFVQCEGVKILLEGNVQVARVIGMEEECLKAARRGRD